MPLNKVQPGDVITSVNWNAMVDAIETLQAGNGQDGSVRILSVFPSGSVRVGNAIEIRGLNFGFSSGAARVHFDSVRVDPAQNSTDSLLHVAVPNLPGLGTGGRQVALSVTHGNSSDAVNIQVLPMAVVLDGNVDVTYLGATPVDLPAGERAEFRYRIRSRATAAADFLISAVTDPSSFEGNLTIPDDPRVDGGVLHLEILESHEMVVVIDPVPAGTDGTSFTLTVAAAAGNVSDASVEALTVGTDSGTPDAGIRILVDTHTPQGALSNGTLTLPSNTLGEVFLNLEFDELGRHDVATTNTSDWVFADLGPASYLIEEPDRDSSGVAHESRTLRFRPGAGASSGVLTIEIIRTGQATGTTMEIALNPT